MNLEHELETASALAREGGALILKYQRAWRDASAPAAPDPAHVGPDGVPFQMKDGNEPVTEADQAVNALCVSRLHEAFPDDALLTEELPDDGSRHRRSRTWLVDPIDGTKDFIAGRPGFSLLIGLLHEGQPALGVVYLPMEDTLYCALIGEGAYRIGSGGVRERLHVSQVSDLRQARMVSSASHPAAVVRKVREAAGISDELHIGSVGIKLSLIAAGERDLYINPVGRTKLWDTCAAEIILREAGGRLTDTTGQPLSYTGEALNHGSGLLASNGLLHEQAIERLRTFLIPG